MFREHKCYGSSVSSLGRINIVVHGPDSLLKSHVGLWKKQPKCLSLTSLTEPQWIDLSPPSHGPQCNHLWPEGPSMTMRRWVRDATPPDLSVPFCRVLPPWSHHRTHKGRPTTLCTNSTCHPAWCQCSARRYQELKGGSQRQTWLSNPGLEFSPAERVNSKDLSG